MKIVVLFIASLSLVQNMYSQVTGRFTSASGQPVPYANVLLLKSGDTSPVKTALTDEYGVYRIDNIAAGTYVLRVSGIGYQTWESPAFELTIHEPVKDFGVQVMAEDVKQLAAVTVRAIQPLYRQQLGGITVNVESSVLSKGSTVLEILARSPGVILDERNRDITLNGKSGVMVMIDGKLLRMPIGQVMNLLNSMSGNDIERIELLTTPAAMFDAEGSAGVINIVLKKNRKRGTNGSFSVTGGYGWGEKMNSSIRLSHSNRGVNVYGSYSFLHDRTHSDMYITSTQDMPALGGRLEVIVDQWAKATQQNHDVTAGIAVQLNTTATIGSSITLNRSTRTSDDFSHLDFTVLPDSLLIFSGHINGKNRWNNLVSSVYLDKEIKEGESLNIDISYLRFLNDNPTNVQSLFVNEEGKPAGNNDSLYAPVQKGFANTGIRVGVIKMDYSRPLNKKMKLETGIKGTYTKSTSSSGIESLVNGAWVNRSETVDHITMKEGIGAVYASVNAMIDTSSNLVIGARYEYAVTDMDNPETKEILLKRHSGVIFPNIMFSRKLNSRSELQLSWTKRISRPGYNDLASFVRYADASGVFTGNPLLQPTITSNVKLGYNYDDYSFSLLFSRDKHPIAWNQLTESPQRNILYVSPQNLAWQHNINLQASLPWKISNWWTMNYSVTGAWRQFKIIHTKQPAEKNYWNWSANFSQSFILPGKWVAELSGWYTSAFYMGTIKFDGMGALNAGVKKEFNNNGGTLQLSVNNVLRSMQVNSYFGAVAEEAFSIRNHVAYNVESRVFPIIKLTYTRSFGSGAKKSRQKESNGAKEAQERIRKDQL